MLQYLVGAGLAVLGLALFAEAHGVLGAVCLVFAFGVMNGARHDTWISFYLEDSEQSDGDGGGDGGGGD